MWGGLVTAQFSLHTRCLLRIPTLLHWFIGSRLWWFTCPRWGCERCVRRTRCCSLALCVPRRECHVSMRATRHTVDSAIDPVCPLGPAWPCLYTHSVWHARLQCCVFAKVRLWKCVCVCVIIAWCTFTAFTAVGHWPFLCQMNLNEFFLSH